MVWARFVKHLVKNSWASLERGLGVLVLGDGDKGILAWLLSLLFLFEVVAGAAFIGVLLLLLLFPWCRGKLPLPVPRRKQS
jgi:hypothetical protein